MLFNSLEFALFLPIVFVLYWFVFNKNADSQNVLLLLASYFFYGWWDWRFLGLIVLSSSIDYFIGLELGKTNQQKQRQLLLIASIAVNIGMLGFFKYYNFFLDQFIVAFASLGIRLNPHSLNVILPVGISFYTFQTLSYTIDVYRRKLNPIGDWKVFFTYVSFFPQLVAGPIERATRLLPQFAKSRQFELEKAKDGMRQILWGLFKKMVIADSCAIVVDDVFANYWYYDSASLLLAVFFFAFQIYCDFSGYSDIAIGTGKLFGIDLMRNFAYPYFSRNVGEFWRRWHISLSTWFRDYLYIPLGGSRVKEKWKLCRNILIIFIVSGFWHGANWTFIVWGALNAIFILPSILLGSNRKFLDLVAKDRFWPSWKELLNMGITFTLISFTWIFFRAESIEHSLGFIWQLYEGFGFDAELFIKNVFLLLGIAILLAVEWIRRNAPHPFQFDDQKLARPIRISIYLTTALAILVATPARKSVFIYFQF